MSQIANYMSHPVLTKQKIIIIIDTSMAEMGILNPESTIFYNIWELIH